MDDVEGQTIGEEPGSEPAPTSRDAYYSLLDEAGTLEGLPRERLDFRRLDLDTALEVLAQDDPSITDAARYHALAELAKGGLPDYERRRDQYARYASSFAKAGEEAGLVTHLQQQQGINLQPAPFLPDELASEVAFTQCRTELATAKGKDGSPQTALWMYCEFESQKPWETLIGWLEPSNWPLRGPLLFDRVSRVKDSYHEIPGAGTSGWCATYLEEVHFLGLPLTTYLDCDYHEGPGFATLTYDLNRSEGDQLTVDRGFLSVTELPDGRARLVRCLKLVAFTDVDEDTLSRMMCPTWRIYVRQAAEADAAGKRVPGDEEVEPPESDPTVFDPDALGRQWQSCVSDASQAYAGFAVDVTKELASGRYDQDDYRRHATWLWMNLARDWSRAWVGMADVAGQLAQLGRGDPRDPTNSPGDPLVDSVDVPIGPLPEVSKLTVSDLFGIGLNPACIGATSVSLAPDTLPASKGGTEVRVTARASGQRPGMYTGVLSVATSGLATTHPVLLYLSGASRRRGPHS